MSSAQPQRTESHPTSREWTLIVGLTFVAAAGIRAMVVDAPGFYTDIVLFQMWADLLVELGPGAFYAAAPDVNYPPVFLYVLWAIDHLLGDVPEWLVKALTIPFDLAIGGTLYVLLRRIADRAAALVACSLYLFNPGVVLAGPWWGQIDAIGILPLLLAFVAAGSGRFATAGALAAFAAMVKPQFGLGLVAVAAFAVVALARGHDWRPLLRASSAAALVLAVLGLPFGLGLFGLFGILTTGVASHPYTTLYAFNVWSLFTNFFASDEQIFLALPLRLWGALLFAAAVAGVLALAWREAPRQRGWGSDPPRDLGLSLAVGVLLVLAFYFLPTRVHERYLFPVFALLAPLAALRPRVLALYLVLTVFFALTVFEAFMREPSTTVGTRALLAWPVHQRYGVVGLSLLGLGTAAALAVLLARARGWMLLRARDRGVAPATEGTAPPASASFRVF